VATKEKTTLIGTSADARLVEIESGSFGHDAPTCFHMP
jgi:hypothetical protein